MVKKRHYEYGQEALSNLLGLKKETFVIAPNLEILERTARNSYFINQCIHISEQANVTITLFISLN